MYFSDYGSDPDSDHGSEHEYDNPYGSEQELQADVESLRAAAKAAGPCIFHEMDVKVPSFFTCSSGVLLWGQLHSLMEGFVSKELDHQLASDYKKAEFQEFKKRKYNQDEQDDGLRRTHNFYFRAPARKGLWKVEALWDKGSIKGYLSHHVDVDGKRILRRTTSVGECRRNDHENREVAYVPNDKWARDSCLKGRKLLPEVLKTEKLPEAPPAPKAAKAPKAARDEDEEYSEEEYSEEEEEEEEESEEEDEYRLLDDTDSDGYPLVWSEDDDELKHRKELLKEKMKTKEMEEKLLKGRCPDQVVADRFMIVDVQGFPHLVQALKVDPARLQESKNYTYMCNEPGSETSSSDSFGVNLCPSKAEREYGWLVFQNGELVGFRSDTVRDDMHYHRHILEYV